jgi:hypothetical protein
MLPHTHTHTPTSFPSFTNIKRKKSKKKNLFGMHEEAIVPRKTGRRLEEEH